jgi:hypothetical protein
MSSKTQKVGKKADYVIAIPSYKRAETLREKSLAVLKEYNIDPKRIDIFVANKEEEKVYKEALEPGSYHKIIVGVPKIGPQRNFISNYYPIGKPVIHMDDDIQGFIEYSPTAKRNEKKLVSLEKVIQRGFAECRKHNCRLWGIYPTPNGYFMNDKVDSDLRFIIGCFNGMFNPGTKGPKGVKLELEMDKEDYERSVRFYIADGAVIRMRGYAPKTAYYTEKGGNQEFRTKKSVMDGAKWMVKTFPDYASLNLTKKSGYPEVRLRDRTKGAEAEKSKGKTMKKKRTDEEVI